MRCGCQVVRLACDECRQVRCWYGGRWEVCICRVSKVLGIAGGRRSEVWRVVGSLRYGGVGRYVVWHTVCDIV